MSEPMTPADCDLRAFATMPLDAVRLFGSEFHAVASDAAWRAGVTLWLRAWHQVPAASLPDDDVQLARLAELGRDVKAWAKVRAQALHGWIKCSDGRLYHPVVAEKANEAWAKRKAFKERSAKGNSKRWGSNKDGDVDPKAILEGPDKDSPNDPKGEERERDSSVTNVTGEPSSPPADPDKMFWDNAKAYLGKSKASMIGRWISTHGRDRAAAAIAQAQVERAADPVPYIEAVLRKPAQAMAGADAW